MQLTRRRTLSATLSILNLAGSVAILVAEGPRAEMSQSSFEFPKAIQGQMIEHAFVLRNNGPAPLRIQGVRLTPPLTLGRMPAQIDPNQEVALPVKLDTSNVVGSFAGEIEVRLNDPQQPAVTFRMAGSVVPLIELSPMAALFVAGTRGTGGEGSIDIINHDRDPLRILYMEHPSERFALKLDTLEEGNRYRLTLAMKADGPGGKAADTILLHTSSPTRPVLKVRANTYLRERVYTFPDVVDLGAIRLSDLKADPARLAQTLMVYQQNGTDFGVTFSSDGPLAIRGERGPIGDRWQATVTIKDEGLRAGPISGSIVVETNDREFQHLTVPVIGTILPD
jgi:hypothetical protein